MIRGAGMTWVFEHAEAIGAFIAGLITGGGASWALAVHFTKQKFIVGGNAVDQSRAKAGGDVVGRDKTVSQPDSR